MSSLLGDESARTPPFPSPSPVAPSPPARIAQARAGLSRRARWSRHGAVLLGFVVLATLTFWQVLPSLSHRYIGVGGDAFQTMAFMAWVSHAFVHHQFLLRSHVFNAPVGINMMWNACLMGIAIIATPLIYAAGTVVTYNVVMIVGIALSAWCAYVAAWRMTSSRVGSIVAGVIYGFGPYMMGQSMGHLTHSFMLFPPVVAYLVYRLFEGSWSWQRCGILIGIATAAQVYVGEEIAATTAIVIIVCCGVCALMCARHVDREQVNRVFAAGVTSLVVGGVLSAPGVIWQFFGPGKLNTPPQPVNVGSLFQVLFPNTDQMIAPHVFSLLPVINVSNLAEADMYLGVPLVALLFIALACGVYDLRARSTAACALVISFLCLGIGWGLLAGLPVVGDILPNRLAADADLLAGLAVAVVVSLTHDRKPRVALGIAACCAFVALMPTLPRPVTLIEVPLSLPPQIAAAIPTGTTVVFAPDAGTFEPLDMLYLANDHFDFRMVGGYAYAPTPPADSAQAQLANYTSNIGFNITAQQAASMAALHNADILSLMHQLNVTTVIDPPNAAISGVPVPLGVVNEYSYHHGVAAAFYTAVLGPPQISANGFLLWKVPPPA